MRRSVTGGLVRRTGIVAVAALLTATGSAVAQSSPVEDVTRGSVVSAAGTLWPANPDWQRYVLAPPTPDVRPVRIVSATGAVDNPTALAERGHGKATLTKVAGGPDPVVVLDYGRNVGGFPYFRVTDVGGNPSLRATYSEAQAFLGPSGDNTVLTGAFGEDLNRYDTYDVARAAMIRNKRIQGAERFEQIRLTTPGTVTLAAVGIHFSSLRSTAADYAGYFVSSSDVLNRAWYQSAYTVQLDSLPADSEPGVDTPPVIVDGAKRDRKVWGGDLLTADQNAYYSTGAAESVKGSLEVLARRQSPDGEISGQATDRDNDYWSAGYSMTWVASLAEYYRYTGDLAFVREQWPTVQRELAWNAAAVDDRGLLITNGWTWHPVDAQMFDGAITADNALYYDVLQGATELAAALGRSEEAGDYQHRAETLKDAVNRELFNTGAGEYDISDTRRDQTAQDANALAVLYGLAPAGRVDEILRNLRDQLWTPHGPLSFSANTGLLGAYSDTGVRVAAISPFSSSLELWARLSSGDTTGGLTLLRTLFGPMSDPANPFYTGTTWEVLNPSGQPGFVSVTSMSHAWGAGAAPALSAYVLGVRPQSAGFRSWVVEPQPDDLGWAQGRVPTPHGPLNVKWGHRGGVFAMEVTAPRATSGTIAVPRFDAGSLVVRVNSHVVWDRDGFHAGAGVRAARQDAGHVYLDLVTGGRYRIDAVRAHG